MIDFAPLLVAILHAHPGIDGARAERYAQDYAAVAANLDEGLALVATARIEGDFDRRVETCVRVGDGGRAISMFQLHASWWDGHPRAEVCGDNRLAAWLGIRALRAMGFERRPEEAFRKYVGCSARDVRVRARVNLWKRLRRST